MSGRVYLVGAGPGDPGLLTLRGAEVLAQADLVLYDGLVNPLLLRYTRGQCERTARIWSEAGHSVAQAEVNERLIAAARAGLTVVRLKGGDPFLFGRGSEEAAALAQAGISFEVVPGVTAAIAAGEYAGISFTHRELASAVAFVTGHEDPHKPSRLVDYAALARFPGTLVFYMGLSHLRTIAEALQAEGLSPTTPTAVISRASLPAQRTVSATLGTIADAAAQAGLKPPSVIVIGRCVEQRERIAWFERRPLFGLRIGITRPGDLVLASERSGSLSRLGWHAGAGGLEGTIARCLEWGAEPVLMPAIEVAPLADASPIDAALARLADFDWLVFTSANGVRAFWNRLWASGGDGRRLQGLRIACIGPATAAALAECHLRADLVPASYRAEELAEALAPATSGRRVLWARASRGRDVLPSRLRAAGASVEELVVYENRDVEAFSPEVEGRLARGEIDWIALSSPSIAVNVARLLTASPRPETGRSPRFAAISPVTAEAAHQAGLSIDAVAETYTWDGLWEAIARAVRTDVTT
jgi:uroporphyrinogen III methyltransferase/synthase